MAANGFLSTSELDFGTFKENLKTFLQGQALFKDYNFEGSNMSVLLDVMAYNTYQNAFYLNMVGSEMFLDTSMLRESAVSHAKELNYVPRSRISAKALVNMTITNVGGSPPATITIPKNFYVTASANGKSYLFSTNESKVVRNEGGSYTSEDLYVYEGRVVTEYYVVNSSSRYVIASANVDTSSLDIIVQTSNTDTSNATFSRAYNLYGLDGTANVYFLQGYASNQYEVVFGNGITGRDLSDGNVVKITYRDCTADEGNYLSVFNAVSQIDSYDVSISTVNTAIGGAERETLDSIKFNAPRHFASQDRAITKNDYEILIRNNFPTIQAIAVFGGEELDEKRYGKVAVATKPFGAEITPDIIKSEIAAFLNDRTSVAIDPIFVDADYFYIYINSIIRYDVAGTSLTTSDIETLVRSAITTYNSQFLYDFNNDFRYSKLVSAIDNSDSSIVSNYTKVKMVKRLAPAVGGDVSFSVKFKNTLVNPEGAYTAGDDIVVTSDNFVYDGTLSYFKDNGLGTLCIHAATGDTLLDASAGTVDYTTGEVNIGAIIYDSYEDHINLYAIIDDTDIIIGQNQILIIDQDDVDITVESVA